MENVKTIIIDQILADTKERVDNIYRARQHTVNESKSHKGAMVSRYDTFKEEAQALTNGFDAQLSDLNKISAELRSIRNNPPEITKGSSYALIEVEDTEDGSGLKYLILPAGGGKTYDIDGSAITAVNVNAPVARPLIGVVVGDEVEMKVKGKVRQMIVKSII